MTREEINIVVDALDDLHSLNDWEIDFIDNLPEKDGKYNLSEKQKETLLKTAKKIA